MQRQLVCYVNGIQFHFEKSKFGDTQKCEILKFHCENETFMSTCVHCKIYVPKHYLCPYAHTFYIYVSTPVYTYVYIHMYVCTYIRMYVHTYVQMEAH